MSPTSSEVANHYARLRIQTASPSKKICMLHIKFLELVVISQEQVGDIKRESLNKAQNILAQLEASLSVDDSVSKSLFFLYDYCYVLLERANDEDLTNAIQVMSILRNTFDELALTL